MLVQKPQGATHWIAPCILSRKNGISPLWDGRLSPLKHLIRDVYVYLIHSDSAAPDAAKRRSGAALG